MIIKTLQKTTGDFLFNINFEPENKKNPLTYEKQIARISELSSPELMTYLWEVVDSNKKMIEDLEMDGNLPRQAVADIKKITNSYEKYVNGEIYDLDFESLNIILNGLQYLTSQKGRKPKNWTGTNTNTLKR